jgi:hypothetical protein
MHATINFNKSIQRTLQYHELKVRKGLAECILADNFLKDKVDLTLKDKLYHFHRLTSLDEWSEKNIFHAFMNFGFNERIADDKLATISREYMHGMRLDQQPFLVYRHDDTHHFHAHIVSTIIHSGGKRVPLSRADYHKSKEITNRLEQQYSLCRSDQHTLEQRLREAPLQKIKYGQMPLLTAMEKVLEAVLPVYKFTSLSELNVLLRSYNMQASRGKENSLTWKNRGIIFRPIIEEGRDESLYIKASVFKCRPTLTNLEKKFLQNQTLRQPHQLRLTTSIDYILLRQKLDLAALRAALQRQQITTVIQRNKEGQAQNIWYVDQQTKCVFDGNALGGRYAMAALQQRCLSDQAYQEQQLRQQQEQQQSHHHRHHLHL